MQTLLPIQTPAKADEQFCSECLYSVICWVELLEMPPQTGEKVSLQHLLKAGGSPPALTGAPHQMYKRKPTAGLQHSAPQIVHAGLLPCQPGWTAGAIALQGCAHTHHRATEWQTGIHIDSVFWHLRKSCTASVQSTLSSFGDRSLHSDDRRQDVSHAIEHATSSSIASSGAYRTREQHGSALRTLKALLPWSR